MNKEQIHYEYELETYNQQADEIKQNINKRECELCEAIEEYALSSIQEKNFLIINNLTQDLINLHEDLFIAKREVDKYQTLINKN